jgi:hypothetical protein
MSKTKQRLVGIALLLLGAGFTAAGWYEALTLHHTARWSAALFPMLGVFGLMLLFAPIDREWLRAQYGVDTPASMEHYTLLQKSILYGGAALTAANYLGLRGAALGWF